MSEQLAQIPEEILELATNLSMQLGIPLTQNPMDIQFVTQCINTILGGLNPNWKPIDFQPKNEEEFDAAWRRIFKIVQSALLMEGQQLIDDNEQIGIENIAILYEVLNQGCQALRQEHLIQMASKKKKKEQASNKKNVGVKNNENKKSYNKSKEKQSKKARPQTAANKRQKIEAKKLQQQIIEAVTKTMNKAYNKKANPESRAKIREKQGTQAVEKAKRTLDYAIKDYQISNRLAEKKTKSASALKRTDLADNAYMKMIANKHKKLNEQLQDQQLRYYVELRDKKVAYIRHIHKLIEKLEREREIEYNKQQREVQHEKKKQMAQKIETVDKLFQQNMQKLNENYQEHRKAKELQQVGEVQICRAMEKSMKEKKRRQMEDLKNLWNAQRNQLFKITSNEQKMKNKLIELYRKYRV